MTVLYGQNLALTVLLTVLYGHNPALTLLYAAGGVGVAGRPGRDDRRDAGQRLDPPPPPQAPGGQHAQQGPARPSGHEPKFKTVKA